MNKEIIDRLKAAGKYERLAIHSLFPESTVRHLEVIEKELQGMFADMVADIIRWDEKDRNAAEEKGVKKEKASNVKKINIG